MEYNELSHKEIHFVYNNEMDSNDFMVKISLVNWVSEGKNQPEMVMKFTDESFNESFKKIPIDYNMFDNIFSKLISLNFNELLIKSAAKGFDGSNLEIKIYYGGSSISLKVWCYDYNYKNRGIEDIYIIFNELKLIYDNYRKSI
jgi:hypothetical protein